MKIRIAHFRAAQINISPGASAGFSGNTRGKYRRLLRWSRDACLVAGVLALGYAGFTMLDAKLYQAGQARQFQVRLSDVRLANFPGNGKSGLHLEALRE